MLHLEHLLDWEMITCQAKEFYYPFDPIVVFLKSAIFAFFFVVYTWVRETHNLKKIFKFYF